MSIGLYVGSFDPFTNGHLEVIVKSLKLCDKLIIGIGVNQDKKRHYDKELMRTAMEATLKQAISLNKFEILIYDGLTSDLAKQVNADFIIRGLRNSKDYNYEEELASINKFLFDLDTIYIRADKYPLVSSSLVRELLKTNQDIKKYVPKEVYDIIVNNKKIQDIEK
ncbi:MAG: pantetheine-phosphate adenylyltransferase [Clostridia bacterium]|nr:pantetheine-phosphate adenylyltransferase [Clostridia bacterium]